MRKITDINQLRREIRFYGREDLSTERDAPHVVGEPIGWIARANDQAGSYNRYAPRHRALSYDLAQGFESPICRGIDLRVRDVVEHHNRR